VSANAALLGSPLLRSPSARSAHYKETGAATCSLLRKRSLWILPFVKPQKLSAPQDLHFHAAVVYFIQIGDKLVCSKKGSYIIKLRRSMHFNQLKLDLFVDPKIGTGIFL
jgi:hypothetical protein